MTITDKLVDQHIREYESRLKHLDELYGLAKQKSAKLEQNHPLKSELRQYNEQYTKLADQTARLKKMPLAHWREDTVQSAGPMAVWDIFAQQLEDFIERIED
ncbi:MAG: hypothetical protein ACI9KN_001895 [Gammaproteobacteria bacterium]|jgi:hypothetical protein